MAESHALTTLWEKPIKIGVKVLRQFG